MKHFVICATGAVVGVLLSLWLAGCGSSGGSPFVGVTCFFPNGRTLQQVMSREAFGKLAMYNIPCIIESMDSTPPAITEAAPTPDAMSTVEVPGR